MKHNLLISANGLCTPPCGSSHRKSLSFQFRNSLLLLFLLIVGSSAAWADCTFTQGETLYLRLGNENGNYWDYDGAKFRATFYNGGTELGNTCMDGEQYSHLYSVVVPYSNATKVTFARRDPSCQWDWTGSVTMTAEDAGQNDCLYKKEYHNSDLTYEKHGSGLTGCGGAPEPEPLSGDYYVFGAGGKNWVTGWTENWNNENYKMTIKDGVATKTFYNVSGQGLEFKIHKGDTQYKSDLLLAEVENDNHLITKVWRHNENIDFNISNKNVTHKADVTVHFDGEHIWLTAVPSPEPVTGSEWYIMGSGNVGTENSLDWDKVKQMGRGNEHKMTVQGGVATITYYNVPNNISFKIFRGSDKYEINDFYYNASASSGIICTDQDGNDNINVNLNNQNITIHWDGTKIWTTEAAPVAPSLQPWSGDSYKDWYLTGDFTNPNVFDGWTMNPSGYKFAANGDNHQKVSITLDPNDERIFHNNNGHKLTRFEIIRQGTWEGPRINKPQFDPTTSNCELQTDWKDANSNRMSLELTAKSVIEFDIWRWGTAPGNADRKVTVTITPVQQVTVTFMANGETFATQTFDKGGKASIPTGTPARSGYNFDRWDWDFNTTVNENTTINAQFSYKPIESVSLNESTHMTWVGNTDFTLIPTLAPSDLITQSVAWSSSDDAVATVNNGTVHAAGEGTATITYTVTDKSGTQKTATCEVTVAACQMIVNNLYSMTVTGYESSIGDNADLSGLWNESSDNNGPASMTITRLAFQKKDAGKTLYAYDESGTVKVKEDVSGDDVQWILIPVGESYTPSWNSGNACPLYYIKNKATGAYMHRGSLGVSTGNPDWLYSVTNTNATNAATDDYKWFFVYESGNVNQRCIFVKSGIGSSKAHSYKLHTSNQYNNCTDTYASKPMLPVGCTGDINDYAKSYNNTSDFNYDTYPNPNYKTSQMNGSYYRMKEKATVRANLNAALVKGAVITVRLYADAATSVKLQKTDGTDIETIDLSADTEREYTYTVASNSALLGENAFVIKATDNHAGIASIVVTRTYAAYPASPELTWDVDTDVTQSALEPAFQHIASSDLSSGAITYTSSNPTVATVAANGTVTPLEAGTTTITATIEAEGCYDEAFITYNVTLTEPSLQEVINAAERGSTITLTHDYNDNAVINKAITIDGNNHTIGDLTVQTAGDLTLSSGLKVRDFTICAKAGNTSTPAASGQVRNAANLTCTGNAYFLYTVDPSGRVQYGWYDFTVPFPVNVMTGIAGIDENSTLKEDFVNERDYAIMEYLGERKAQGQYPYQKFRSVMQPNQLYSITLDSRDNYNTVRFQKTADGNLVASNTVTLNEYTGSGTYNNLNGVGNGTLHHANADNLSVGYVQVYQSGDKTFLPVETANYSFVVGTAFMVQETGRMTLSPATHGALLAPSRYESAPATAIQIAREGQPFLSQGNDYFSDQLFISANETGGQAYTQGTDLAKAGNIGNVNVPQIWTNAYNTKLCVHEAQLINGEASYNLSIYAPAADTYTLTSKNIPADYSLYLTQNGMILTELNGTYTLDLNKGITTEYGLLLVETYKTPTGIEESGIRSQESGIRKILHNGVLYILHNGKIYNAQGAKVK